MASSELGECLTCNSVPIITNSLDRRIFLHVTFRRVPPVFDKFGTRLLARNSRVTRENSVLRKERREREFPSWGNELVSGTRRLDRVRFPRKVWNSESEFRSFLASVELGECVFLLFRRARNSKREFSSFLELSDQIPFVSREFRTRRPSSSNTRRVLSPKRDVLSLLASVELSD